jgi:hypothetical protein
MEAAVAAIWDPFKKGETSVLRSHGCEDEDSGSISYLNVEDFDVEGLEEDDSDGGEYEIQTKLLPSLDGQAFDYECILPSSTNL